MQYCFWQAIIFRENLSTKMERKNVISGLFLGLIILFTVACIKWPDKNKPLGDEYECHIYSRDTFFQFYPLYENGGYILKRGPDVRYDFMWDFVYNENAKAYEISFISVDNRRIFITLNSNNELEFSESCVDESDRWKLEKVDNGIFYMIVNATGDYALTFISDDPRDVGGAEVLNPQDDNFWMRLQ